MTDDSFSAEKISDAELVVMDVLWADAPLTAVDVAQRVDPARNWSLATVKTLLSRLVGKAAVATQADGRRFLYRPRIERDAYVAIESTRLVDRLFGGRLSPLVAHLAEHKGLSDADIAELEAILREMKP